MIVVLIRRFVRPEREKEFLGRFQREKPLHDPNFKGEILVRVNDDPSLPEVLRTWKVAEPNCITYVNIAKWDSWKAFAAHFNVDTERASSSNYDPKIETAARQVSILGVFDDDVDLDHDEIISRRHATPP